jgi:hypothetical protein
MISHDATSAQSVSCEAGTHVCHSAHSIPTGQFVLSCALSGQCASVFRMF